VTSQPRLALVTGGAAGLGRAFARRLAADGFRVAIADLGPADETVQAIRQAGGDAHGYRCDVSDPASVADIADAVRGRQGVVDVLVNNAGIYPLIPWTEMTLEQWRHVHAVNLDSMFLTTKAFVPSMVERGWGRVVNITSGSGWIPSVEFSAYVTSKLGVVGYTRGLAIEVGDTGVTVNAIAPSLVRTATIVNSEHGQFFDEIAALQSIRRVQEPEDLVGTLSYLVSDDAAFMTGQTLSIDGGYVRF
jgi:NAD(P)-dependent dehydrogenase (short-subunit alcohol dehydrogenase family)